MVIDVALPDSDGRDLGRALRALGCHAPVLFLTTPDAVTDRMTGFGAGGHDYATKPLRMDEVLARLRELLRRGGTEAPAQGGARRVGPAGGAPRGGAHWGAPAPAGVRPPSAPAPP